MEPAIACKRSDEDQFVGLVEATVGLKCHRFMTKPHESEDCLTLVTNAYVYQDVAIVFRSGDQIVVQSPNGFIEVWEFAAGESERADVPLWQAPYHEFFALLAFQ